jgi:hypothetical protein
MNDLRSAVTFSYPLVVSPDHAMFKPCFLQIGLKILSDEIGLGHV